MRGRRSNQLSYVPSSFLRLSSNLRTCFNMRPQTIATQNICPYPVIKLYQTNPDWSERPPRAPAIGGGMRVESVPGYNASSLQKPVEQIVARRSNRDFPGQS